MRRTDEPTTAYPPTSWDTGSTFEAPGPVSRPLANYLAMCAPRRTRIPRASRVRDAKLTLAFAAAS